MFFKRHRLKLSVTTSHGSLSPAVHACWPQARVPFVSAITLGRCYTAVGRVTLGNPGHRWLFIVLWPSKYEFVQTCSPPVPHHWLKLNFKSCCKCNFSSGHNVRFYTGISTVLKLHVTSLYLVQGRGAFPHLWYSPLYFNVFDLYSNWKAGCLLGVEHCTINFKLFEDNCMRLCQCLLLFICMFYYSRCMHF